MDVLDLFIESDADFDRSTAVKRVVVDVISCYKELPREKKLRARQSTLDAFFKKEDVPNLAHLPASDSNLLSQRCQVHQVWGWYTNSLYLIFLSLLFI
jgi:hypothetical protein